MICDFNPLVFEAEGVLLLPASVLSVCPDGWLSLNHALSSQ